MEKEDVVMDEIKDFLKSRAICNLLMVIINIAVFLGLEIVGCTENVPFMAEHGACYTPWILEYGEYYRLLTSMFLHFGIEHLANNMLVLMFLGDTLERAVGEIRYLIIYLGGGILANIFSCAMEYRTGEYSVSAGASGAVFAVIGALIYVVIVNRGRLEDISARRLILMAVLSLFQGFTSIGVDNAAHAGGLVFGLFLGILLYRRPRRKVMQEEEGW